ncbi:hypothetical protein GQ457_06G008640 [Hibiscus cannabinus]
MDSEMNRVCYCRVRSKLTMSWTYEIPAVTERSKGVIIGLLKKMLQWSKRERMKEFLEFYFLVLCFWWVLFWEKNFLAFDLGFRWVKVVAVKGGFGFMLLKFIVVNGGFGV